MLTRLPMAGLGWRRPAAARHSAARIASYKTARLLRRTDNTRCRYLPGPDNMREVSIGHLAVYNGREGGWLVNKTASASWPGSATSGAKLARPIGSAGLAARRSGPQGRWSC